MRGHMACLTKAIRPVRLWLRPFTAKMNRVSRPRFPLAKPGPDRTNLGLRPNGETHAPPDDRVVTFAVQNGFEPVFSRPFKGDRLGLPGPDMAGPVVYGGPFKVFEDDKHPFLRDEVDWMRACLAQGVPLLGLCQGGPADRPCPWGRGRPLYLASA